LKKYIYSTYSPRAPHTYDFVVVTSLTHSRKILLVALQIGKWEIRKARDLSATLHIMHKPGHIAQGDPPLLSIRINIVMLAQVIAAVTLHTRIREMLSMNLRRDTRCPE
jgi:hypothetical protein